MISLGGVGILQLHLCRGPTDVGWRGKERRGKTRRGEKREERVVGKAMSVIYEDVAAFLREMASCYLKARRAKGAVSVSACSFAV